MDLVQEYLIIETPVLLLLICCSLLFVGFYLWFVYFPYGVLNSYGFKGPPPSIFYGHFKEIARYGNLINYFEHLKKKYGKLVGFYIGQQPCILVSDLDLIKDIIVKDFEYFRDRPDRIINPFHAFNLPTGLVFRKGDHWRKGRRVVTPTFSASKMKLMEPLMSKSARMLVKKLEEHAKEEESVEMFRTFGDFTMETILSTAFGRVIDIQNGESNTITKAAATLFTASKQDTVFSLQYLTVLSSNFPFLKWVLPKIVKYTNIFNAIKHLKDTADAIINQRRSENSRKHKDFLQLMIDTEVEEEGHVKSLPNEEIITHSITFMLAGYETTANALTYTSYLLALNPDVQLKLQEEIDLYFESNPTSSLYHAAQELKYLDMVINESLRLYPPVASLLRFCVKNYTNGDLAIPKGVTIYIPAMLIHKDSEYWENPEEFNPLRFSPEEKVKHPQFSFLPFGAGPRNCIGMRLAMLEAKIALIEMMKKISFVRAPDTEVPLKTVHGITVSPKNGVYIKIALRQI